MSARGDAARGLLLTFALIAILLLLGLAVAFTTDGGTLAVRRMGYLHLAVMLAPLALALRSWKLAAAALVLLLNAACAARGPWVRAEAPPLELRACPCWGVPCMHLITDGDCLMPPTGFDGKLLLRVSWDPADLGACPAVTVRWPMSVQPARRSGEGVGCWIGPGRDYSYPFSQRFGRDDEGTVEIEARGEGRRRTAKLEIRRPPAVEGDQDR